MPEDALQGLRGTETVLVVDDLDVFRDIVVRLLELLGYTALSAADGPTALDLLARHPVDVVLTDVRMPRMTGPELAAAVRRIRPGCALIFMTGYGGGALPAHPDVHVIEKPFSHAALARGLRDVLGR